MLFATNRYTAHPYQQICLPGMPFTKLQVGWAYPIPIEHCEFGTFQSFLGRCLHTVGRQWVDSSFILLAGHVSHPCH
uniref:Uncharacterized protein n=1 Tax=Anguilla anguilla TaxID=7936 RepID=A0A0E9XFD2_ANGAN